MLIHDVIKIKYIREGFLPDYPYHLISDQEMIQAFLREDKECFFYDMYPCPCTCIYQNCPCDFTDCNRDSCSHYSCEQHMTGTCPRPQCVCRVGSRPCIRQVYQQLLDQIRYHIERYLAKEIDRFPNWVYSYMMGAVIGPNSHQYDIHDLLVMINHDNIEDEIRIPAYLELYNVSMKYVKKLEDEEKLHRPPTIFGEPHVIKILRLEQSEI